MMKRHVVEGVGIGVERGIVDISSVVVAKRFKLLMKPCFSSFASSSSVGETRAAMYERQDEDVRGGGGRVE